MNHGSKLLTNANVKLYIDEQLALLHDKRIAKTEKTFSDVMNGKSKSSVLAMCGDGCQEAIEKPPDERNRLKAAELLGRRYGMFT